MPISSQPTNQSLAQPTKFRLIFDRIPNVTFFCQSVNLPGLGVSPTQQTTPFVDAYIPGDKVSYDPLNISFLVDEDYRSWFDIHDWLRGLAFPENFEQYKQMQNYSRFQQKETKGKPQYSDATLTLYTNQNNPNLRIKFIDCFPESLSGIDFSTQSSAENVLTATASFRYSYFTYERA